MARSNSFAYIGFAAQSSLGTSVAPVFFPKWKSISELQPKRTIGQYRDGLNRNFSFTAGLKQSYGGKFVTWLTPNVASALIFYALGMTDTVTGGGDPYTHSGLETNVLLTPLTFEHSMGHVGTSPLDVVRVQDCYISELKITSKGAELVECDVSFEGGPGTPGQAASTVTFDTDRPFEHPDATFTFNAITASTGDVVNWMIDIKNTLDPMGVPSIQPVFLPGARQIDVSFDVFPSDDKLWRDIFYGSDAGTTQPIANTEASSLVALWDLAGSPDHKVTLTCNNVDFSDAKPAFDSAGKPFTVAAKGINLTKGGTAAVSVASQNARSTAYH